MAMHNIHTSGRIGTKAISLSRSANSRMETHTGTHRQLHRRRVTGQARPATHRTPRRRNGPTRSGAAFLTGTDKSTRVLQEILKVTGHRPAETVAKVCTVQ